MTTNIDDLYNVSLEKNVRKRINFGKVCPKFSHGDFCAECTKSDELFKASRSEDDIGKQKVIKDQAKMLYARPKIFVNAINVKDDDKTYPVRVYALPPSVFDDLVGQLRGAKELNKAMNVFHPIKGRNIMITKKGQLLNTRYTPQIDSEPTPIPNKQVLEMLLNGDLSCLHNLREVENFVRNNYEHITQLEQDINIIRLMPPFSGDIIYHELRFHRYTVESYLAFAQSDDTPKRAFATARPSPAFRDEFNPLDLEEPAQPTPVQTPAPEETPVDGALIEKLRKEVENATGNVGGAIPDSITMELINKIKTLSNK